MSASAALTRSPGDSTPGRESDNAACRERSESLLSSQRARYRPQTCRLCSRSYPRRGGFGESAPWDAGWPGCGSLRSAMPMHTTWLHIRFGRFVLDEAIHELRADGVTVAIEPKPLALLLLLARERHRVVRRDEIHEALWPGIAVGEDSLTRAVLKAREALGDTGASGRMVRTVRGVGFRFVAPVEEEEPEQEAAGVRRAERSAPASPGHTPLLGRARELALLEAALRSALAGGGRVVQVSGAAGTGKTRLAEEFLAAAHGAGAEVHRARAWEGAGAPALWPWSQVLRSFSEQRTTEALRAAMGREEAAELARVLPELRETFGVEMPLAPTDGDEARFRMLDALSHFLVRAAHARPQVIVLEDMHWADGASLRVLGALAGEMAGSRILILVTFREEEAALEHPLAEALATCLERDVLVRVPLQGLEASEVGRLLQGLAGFLPPPEVVAAIHARTGGNPFFVKQIIALAQAEHADTPAQLAAALVGQAHRMPPEMRHVVGRRLARLSASCRQMLAAAAVWGREFPVAGLAKLPGLSREALLSALTEAAAARVIEAEAGFGGSYVFVHDLLRQVILAELEPQQRVRLHLHVGEALETLHAAHLEPVVSALALHYGEAALLVEGTKAVDYAQKAGELARDALAYEEATEQFERALRALELLSEPDLARRAELMVCLGYACHSAGRHERGHEVLREAAAVARAAGSAGPLALAAAGLAEVGIGLADPETVGLLEDALRLLGDGGGRARLGLQCILAINLANLPGRLADATRLVEAAAAIAQDLGDPRSRSTWLSARAAVQRISPQTLPEERLAGLNEAAALAHASGDLTMELVARLQRFGALTELALRSEMDAELGTIETLISRLRSPYWGYVMPSLRGMCCLLEGRFGEAEALFDEAFTSPESPRIAFVAGRLGNLAAIRYDQGRMTELLPLLGPLAQQFTHVHALRTAWMLALLEAGRTQEAHAIFAPFADRAATDVVGTESWLCAMAMLAEICARIGDEPRARTLFALLEPRAEQCVIVANGHYCHGPVALYLGMLACTFGEYEHAGELLDLSLVRSEALASPVWRAHTLAARARMLLARGARVDRVQAKAAGGEAHAIAQRLGMERLCRALDALGTSAAAQRATGR
ncbi:MAG: AAA family ATPase [Deltaproteobacteria bacterium]|nr:AAA family ATPase [Deltaproteobacteria bacterium]